MGMIRVLTTHEDEVEIEAEAGKTLLLAAISQAKEIPFACLGGDCHTCKVKILAGNEDLMEPHEGEAISLGAGEIEAGYRLSCQAFCKGL